MLGGARTHPAHAITLDAVAAVGGAVVSGMWVVAVREVGGGVAQLAVRLEGANGVDKQALEGLMPTVRSGGSCGASSPWWGRRRVWGIGPALGDDTRHRNCRNRDAALGGAESPSCFAAPLDKKALSSSYPRIAAAERRVTPSAPRSGLPALSPYPPSTPAMHAAMTPAAVLQYICDHEKLPRGVDMRDRRSRNQRR